MHKQLKTNQDLIRDPTLEKGVLVAEIHHVEGPFEAKEYFVDIDCTNMNSEFNSDGSPLKKKSSMRSQTAIFKNKTDNVTKPMKPPLQFHSSFSFAVEKLIESQLTISLYKQGRLSINADKLGTFKYQLV